jgi:hypothetical protein
MINRENLARDSILCVTSSNGKFVKFRITGARGADAAEPLRFIEAWSALLWPGA